MLSWIVEFLPLFVVRHLAQDCERTYIGGRQVTVPRPGVLIEVDKPKIKPHERYPVGLALQ